MTCVSPKHRPKEVAVRVAATEVKESFTHEEALAVATELGIDFKAPKCDLEAGDRARTRAPKREDERHRERPEHQRKDRARFT